MALPIPMPAPDPDEIATTIELAIQAWSMNRPRTRQSEEKVLGASDIGHCRQYATLMLRGVPFTDSPSTYAAAVGTWLHSGVDEALAEVLDPTEWLTGEAARLEVTAHLKGWDIVGHPDLLYMGTNTCLDVKSKPGLYGIQISQNNRYQRTIYAIAAQQAGLLQEGPLYAGNVFMDRQGRQPRPIVDIELVTPELVAEIEQWLEDVTYAVTNNEDAKKDVVPSVCEIICPFYTHCRAGEDWRGSGIVLDEEKVAAVERYFLVNEAWGQLDKERDYWRTELMETSGVAGDYTIRWTAMPGSESRRESVRLDVRRARK